MVDDVRKIAERLALNRADDVVWLSERDPVRGGNQLCVAPLQVWGQLRDKLLTDKTVICTSATLKLGGDFTALATSIGLKPSERVDEAPAANAPGVQADPALAAHADAAEPPVLPWRGIDVGSPFDYPRQGILYVARGLPAPGRDGIGPAQLDEIQRLVEAGRAARSACSPLAGRRKRRRRRSARPSRTCRSCVRGTASSRTCRLSSSPTLR